MTSPREPALLSPSPQEERDLESTPHPPPMRSVSAIPKLTFALRALAVIILTPAVVLLALYGDKIRRIHPSSWPLEWIFATASSLFLIILLALTLFLRFFTPLRYFTTSLLLTLPAASAILLLVPGINTCPNGSHISYHPPFLPSSPHARSHRAWTSRDPSVCIWNRALVGLLFATTLVAAILILLEFLLYLKSRKEANIHTQWERDEEERRRGIRLEVGSLGGSIGLGEMVERTMMRGSRESWVNTNQQSWPVSTNGRTVTEEDIAAYRAGEGAGGGIGNAGELYPGGRPFSEVSPVDDGQWTDFTGERSYNEGDSAERWGDARGRGSVGYGV